ncbi:helix-turn-helix domain-containing protein [Longirhabdus pacifica]|uniref:helix-turn-helix domain-containing protein n=1 Tax=Longirhabdus pacifica TaxID=2305227 RepID=UPI001008A2A7|nr:helix-turn-helix transcriptional regulator [Longirhabdus pacifica]
MNFYEKLKDIRKLKGYTIREVSDRSGVSSAYISQLENGNRSIPSPDILKKLSDGLNISYSELMNVAGYIDTGQPKQRKAPVHLRRFLRDNDIVFDGIELTNDDKEWIDRVLTALFWQRNQKK